jgi:hypothetical protein
VRELDAGRTDSQMQIQERDPRTAERREGERFGRLGRLDDRVDILSAQRRDEHSASERVVLDDRSVQWHDEVCTQDGLDGLARVTSEVE